VLWKSTRKTTNSVNWLVKSTKINMTHDFGRLLHRVIEHHLSTYGGRSCISVDSSPCNAYLIILNSTHTLCIPVSGTQVTNKRRENLFTNPSIAGFDLTNSEIDSKEYSVITTIKKDTSQHVRKLNRMWCSFRNPENHAQGEIVSCRYHKKVLVRSL
jgi:hypothetical protein